MAELLSILQVAEIATKTSIQLYDFFSTITHAPQEIRGITRDVNSFNTLVCNLTASLKSPDVRAIIENDLEITNAIESLKEPIGNSRKTFEKMEEKLRPHLKEDISSSEPPKGNGDAPAQQRRLSRTDVKWYFKRKEVYSLLGEMERNKVTFGDAMGYVTLLLSFKTSAIMKANSAATGPKPQDATIKTPFDDDAGSALIRFAETASTLSQGSLSDSKTLVDTRSSMVEPEETESQLTDTLIQAVKIGSLPLVKASLEKANINGQDRDGRTPLSFAAELGHVQVTELLLARGAIVSIRQYSNHRQQGSSEPLRESGRTPLLWAAAKGNSAIVHLLLQYGANPNARSTSGRFALQEATMNNNVDIVKLLLQYKADANARSYNFGWTVMHEAALHGRERLVQLFLRHEVSYDTVSTEKDARRTPLHLAVYSKRHDITQTLLEQGADVNAQMLEDTTALHLAAAGGWYEGAELLLGFGALIDARDAFLHETPLHKAARNRQMKVIGRLCKHGANKKAKNIDGQDYTSVLACAQESPRAWNVSIGDASLFSM